MKFSAGFPGFFTPRHIAIIVATIVLKCLLRYPIPLGLKENPACKLMIGRVWCVHAKISKRVNYRIGITDRPGILLKSL